MYKATTYHVSLHLWDWPFYRFTAKFVNRLTAKLVDRMTTKLVDRLTAKLVDRLTAKLVDHLTAMLVVVNLVKLHLTKF